jgi:16S rRNA (adenine1518-N6/adenine1519-N6)-dimethyltransferase
LQRFGIRTSKRLGQHFLTDETVVQRIAESLSLTTSDRVLEIGPGIGTLTQALAMTGAQVTAVELDRRFIDILAVTLQAYPNVRVVQGDILQMNLHELMGDEPFQLAGNLPYYITTPIVMRFLEEKTSVQKMSFMVQREVAERMVAAPGGKDYGALSVAVQFRTEASLLFDVPPEVFLPPPAVESAVVHCRIRTEPPVSVPSEQAFFRVTRAAFAQRRKTLANSMKGAGIEAARVEFMLSKTGIDGGRRGETMSLAEFAKLAWEYTNGEGKIGE